MAPAKPDMLPIGRIRIGRAMSGKQPGRRWRHLRGDGLLMRAGRDSRSA